MGFSNRRLVFTLKPGTHYRNGTEVVIRVDQGNKLKANCGIDAGGNENFTLAIRALALGPRVNKYDQRIRHVTAVTTAVVNESTKIEGDCPVTDATVSIIPPMPQKLMDMIISFRTGMHLNPGDNITIFLGGLTNGNMSGGVFKGYDVQVDQDWILPQLSLASSMIYFRSLRAHFLTDTTLTSLYFEWKSCHQTPKLS